MSWLSVYINQFVNLDGIPNTEAGLVFIGAIIFIGIYGTRSAWNSNAPGRALMYWVVSFACLVLMNTIHLATGRYPGIEFVRIGVYSLLLYSVVRLIVALLHILRDGEQITTSTFVKPKKSSSAERETQLSHRNQEGATIMSTPNPGNLGTIITNATIRKGIYSAYVVALVIVGGVQVAFANPDLGGQPTWLTVTLSVLAYLGVPIGGLALANTATPAQNVTIINGGGDHAALLGD